MARLLLFSVFVISTCGLIYELISGTLASYILGDSVTQFSTVIGVYLFSMGVGSYLSKFVEKRLIQTFINVELLIGMVGGFSALLLFVLFEHVEHFRILLYSFVVIIGILVGLEIPLMMRLLKDHYTDFKELVSKVFSFDYIGALLASIIFPLLLVPYLGLARSALLFGIINVLVGMLAIFVFRKDLVNPAPWYSKSLFCIFVLLTGFVFSHQIVKFSEEFSYEGKIIISKSSPYQKIVLTRQGSDLKLYLNRNLQFSAKDEYRYHEALVHPGLSQLIEPKKVLVLGGGDGLAVREILKYPSIESITLVDLDPTMTKLFQELPLLKQLNNNALLSDKLKIYNQDAFLWLKSQTQNFDFIVIDLPDPTSYGLGKLYTQHFYRHVWSHLKPDGIVVVQSTAPYISRMSYWCIANTLESSQFHVSSYTTFIPSFGLWGYHMASKKPLAMQSFHLPKDLRYITKDIILSLFEIPADMSRLPTEVNALNNQALVRYFDQEWQRYLS